LSKFRNSKEAICTEKLDKHTLVILNCLLGKALQYDSDHLIEEGLDTKPHFDFLFGRFLWLIIRYFTLFIICEPQASQSELATFHQSNETLPTDIVQVVIVLLDTLCQLKSDINESFLAP